MALSYFDKAIIFLLPLVVLFFFKDKTVYVSIEYIYSITVVIIPLIDLGLSGYFLYAYRNSINREKSVNIFVNVFQRIYIFLFILGAAILIINYSLVEFNEFLLFIISRLLFVLATVFLASYFRLTNNPEKAVYITILSNILSLAFLVLYFLFDIEFSMWLIFFGQIIFAVGYFFKSLIDVFFLNGKVSKLSVKAVIKQSLIFSWPSIIQVFIMMYIVNYGKINVLTKMTLDDGVLLSLVQRLSMVIFLTHSSIWAFLIKDVYIEKNLFIIKRSIVYKYLVFLTLALMVITIVAGVYIFYNYTYFTRVSLISILIIGQVFFACIYNYSSMQVVIVHVFTMVKQYIAC